MIVLTNVLVATDFTPPSDAALTYGRALARAFGASLHVLHVTRNLFLRPIASDPQAIRAGAWQTLREQLTADDRSELHACAVLETSDDPADAITEYARTANVDLIVMGTHGRSGLSQLLVGSVAERVVRTAPCPVLTVRQPEHEFVVPDAAPRDAARAPRPSSRKDQAAMIALKKILVATDFSEPSEAALAYGRELARTFGSTLLVAHVVENVGTGAVGADGFVFNDPSLQKDVDATARKRVESLLSDEDRAVLSAEAVVIVSNAPAYAIVDYAREANVDLIVMGTHGRGAVAHLLMGSVAERVVRLAPCPVLTVRHPEHEFVRPDWLVAVAKA